MRKDSEEKVTFICVGKDEDCSVQWFKANTTEDAKISDKGKTIFIVIHSDGRTTLETDDLMTVVKYTQDRTVAKGRGKQSTGNSYIYWIGEKTGKEYLIAVVTRTVTRRFRPVYPKTR